MTDSILREFRKFPIDELQTAVRLNASGLPTRIRHWLTFHRKAIYLSSSIIPISVILWLSDFFYSSLSSRPRKSSSSTLDLWSAYKPSQRDEVYESQLSQLFYSSTFVCIVIFGYLSTCVSRGRLVALLMITAFSFVLMSLVVESRLLSPLARIISGMAIGIVIPIIPSFVRAQRIQSTRVLLVERIEASKASLDNPPISTLAVKADVPPIPVSPPPSSTLESTAHLMAQALASQQLMMMQQMMMQQPMNYYSPVNTDSSRYPRPRSDTDRPARGISFR